jgi:two-component system, cell cycle sensor histidine kinase and response regulator CckA
LSRIRQSERVHASARERLRVGSLGAAAASAIYLGYVCLAHPEIAVPSSIYCGALAVFSVVLFACARLKELPEEWIPTAGAALLLAMGGGVLHGFVLLRAPSLTVFMGLIVLAAGALHSHTRSLLVVVVVCVASWLIAGGAMIGPGFALPAAGLVCVAIVSLIAHRVLMGYVRALDALREQDRSHHVELAAALATARHELAERNRAESEREALREQLQHAQKLEAIGTLAAGVAHDINNVLAAILAVAEFLRQDASESTAEDVDQIIEAARRGGELTRNLLGFGRRGKYRKERLDLAPTVTGVVKLLSRSLPKSIELRTTLCPGFVVEGDPSQLSQALVNLCLNGSDAMNGTGVLDIRVAETHLAGNQSRAIGIADGRYVALSVADTGSGMPAEAKARMFEPFFTTKDQGRGTGLGLAMVYGTVANHGGAIAVESAIGQGTTVTVYLPLLSAPPRVEAREKGSTVCVPPSGTGGDAGLILLVDDEPMVRKATRRSLERAGYRVMTAEDGSEAVQVFREHGGQIEAVVLDMVMPVMGGADCFRALRGLDPELGVILVSGYALEKDARDCLAAGAVAFLEKPYDPPQLIELVRSACSGSRATSAAPVSAAP